MRWSSLTLLALAVVLVSGVAPLGLAASTPQDGGENYTLDELQQDGIRHDNSPPSVRMADSDRMFWLVHWPAGDAFARPGEDDNWEFVAPGTTVKRNAIYLRTIHFGEPETITVKVVSWQKGEKVTTGPNGSTTTETVPVNVTTQTHQVQLQQGWPSKKIELPRHDQPHHVTIWIEEYPNARWSTFEHKSVATTKPISISTWGDYLRRNLVTTYLPIIGVLIVVLWAVKKAIDQAGTGPQWGYFPWFLVISVVSGIGFFAAYTQLADLFVLFPAAAALYIGAIVAAIALETYTRDVSTALFWQPRLEFAQSPTGELSYDSTFGRIGSYKLVDMADGSRAIVKGGLLAFLSRVFGGAARLEFADEITTRVELEGSKWDELYYVYAIAGLTIAALATLVAVGVLTVRPKQGEASVEPAAYHTRGAHHTVMNFTEGVADADTLQEAQEQLIRERIHPEMEVQERVEQKDSTLVEEALDADVDLRLSPPDEDENVSEDITENEQANGEVADDD